MKPILWHELAVMTGLSLEVAGAACVLILIPGIVTGYLTSRVRFIGRELLDTILLLPLVLPPVAVGLALLYLLAADGPIGSMIMEAFDASLLLTPLAGILAAACVSFPLLHKSAQQAFKDIPEELESLARVHGKTRTQIFREVSLPLAWPGILQGLALAFARGVGEFGATMLVAGNIPGRTETLALGIYDRILAGRDDEAAILCGIALALGLAALVASRLLERRKLTGKTP